MALILPPAYRGLDIRPPPSEHYKHQRFVYKGDKVFPLLAEKGYQVYNSCKRNILAIGPKKCLAPSERIFTPNGVVPIGDMAPGSAVCGFAGNTSVNTVATEFHRKQELEAVRMELRNGKYLVCSPEHEWWCCVGGADGQPMFGFVKSSTIRELIAAGRTVSFPFCQPELAADAPFSKADLGSDLLGKRTVILDEDTAYLLGAMAGDGSCQTSRDGKHRSLAFHNIDAECLSAVNRALKRFGSELRQKSSCDYSIQEPAQLRELIIALKMNVRGELKHIPDPLFASHKSLRSFLRGLFDTDGTADKKGTVCYVSQSEHLSRDVMDALARFGVFSQLVSRYSKCSNGKICGPYWYVWIYGVHARRFFDVIGFSIAHKQARRGVQPPERRVRFGYPDCIRAHILKRKRAVFNQAGKWSNTNRDRKWHKQSGIGHAHKFTPSPIVLNRIVAIFGDDDVFKAFRISDTWVSVSSVTDTVSALVDITVPRTNAYYAGGYPSHNCGKTLAVTNRLLRHLWETDGAVAAVLCKTQANAKIGSWRDLTRIVLPGWVDANFGFEVLVHKNDPASKMEYYIVRNMHGGESTIQCHSLHFEGEVEDKFRSARFSAIWLAESDLFEERATYDALEMQLRMPHLKYEEHLFLFDCNPPEQGEDHWLIKKFWEECNPESELYVAGLDEKMARFEFKLDDNPFLPDEEKEGIKRTYQNDPMGWARFVEGRVVKDVTSGHFAGFFIESIHNIGDARSQDKTEWETLVPSNVSTLLIGIDTGDMSHSTTLLCPRINDRAETAYDCFDELTSIDTPLGLNTYFKMLAAKLVFWNQWMTEAYGLKTLPTWRIWPDSSLWNFRANSERSDIDLLLQALSDAGVKNFQIMPVLTRDQKAKGQVAKRIALVKRLLHDNRLFVSAHCKATLNAMRFLRPAKHGKRTGVIIKPGIPERHPFDSLTYPLMGELPMETMGTPEPPRSTGIYFT